MRQTSHAFTDAQENFTSFDTNVVMVRGGANMVVQIFFNEKPTKIENYGS